MNLSRIQLLFTGGSYNNQTRDRLITVLTACCQSAKNHAVYHRGYGNRLALTDNACGCSIDEVMAALPFRFGSPTKPEYQRVFKIYEVLATIEELKSLGYLDDENDDYEVITLTDELFHAIAEEWAYVRGVRPQRVHDEKVFASTFGLATAIAERRLRRLQRKEVALP